MRTTKNKLDTETILIWLLQEAPMMSAFYCNLKKTVTRQHMSCSTRRQQYSGICDAHTQLALLVKSSLLQDEEKEALQSAINR